MAGASCDRRHMPNRHEQPCLYRLVCRGQQHHFPRRMYVLHIGPMRSILASLDETIVGFRVATQRPAYRQRLLEGLDFDGGIASLRLLRSVERLTHGTAGPSIRRVAVDLGVEHSTASRSADTLVRSGLLSRQRCSSDQRQARLGLTKRGRAILGQTTARRQKMLASLVQDWSDDDLRLLTDLLAHLRDAFDEEYGRR